MAFDGDTISPQKREAWIFLGQVAVSASRGYSGDRREIVMGEGFGLADKCRQNNRNG